MFLGGEICYVKRTKVDPRGGARGENGGAEVKKAEKHVHFEVRSTPTHLNLCQLIRCRIQHRNHVVL